MSLRSAFAVICLLGAAACGTATSPTTIVTDTLSGTFVVGGVGSSNFNQAGTSDITIALTALSPQSTITVAVGFGTQSSTGCGYSGLSYAAVGSSFTVTAVPAGSYCVVVQDIGNATQSNTYTIQVTHAS
jgi:hypothetical protein